MRILWIVNVVMPELAEQLKIQTGASGTWLIDIAKRLSEKDDIQLAIACVCGDKYQKVKVNNTIYYMLPGNGKNMLFYTKKYERIWRDVEEDFKPDIVHIHGTEYSHGLSYVRMFPESKCVVSIQGILNRIKDVDYGGMTLKERLCSRTLKEMLRLNGMFEMHILHMKNAFYEKEMLSKVQYVNCVNFWDKSLVKSINPNLKVFLIDYNLRREFYEAPKWNYEEMIPYTIFTNPGGTPLKGIHQLFKAIAIVKQSYPQTRLYVPGMGNEEGELVVTSGYTKYLRKLIKKLKIENNVVFLGKQSGEQMVNQMRSANVVVVPSAIEGTSLILREAMYLGCPSIASFRGGMADFITDKYDGYLYDYQEFPYLAGRIMEIFDNKKISMISKSAIEKATCYHNPEKNFENYIKMYQQIGGEK